MANSINLADLFAYFARSGQGTVHVDIDLERLREQFPNLFGATNPIGGPGDSFNGQGPLSNPVNPNPANPNPVNPDPANPNPVNPDPVNPDPVNPNPVNPNPVNPDPVNPNPANPNPANPDPVNPDPVNSEQGKPKKHRKRHGRSYQQKIDGQNQFIKDTNNRINNLQKQIDALEAKANKTEEDLKLIEELKQKQQTALAEIEKAKQKIANFEQKMAELAQNIDGNKAKIEELTNEVNGLKEKIAEMENNGLKGTEEYKKLVAELESKEQRIASLEKKMSETIKALELSREVREKEISEIRAKIKKLEENGKRGSEEFNKLVEELKGKEKELETVEKKMTKVVGILKNMRSRISGLTTVTGEHTAQLGEQAKKIEELTKGMKKAKRFGIGGLIVGGVAIAGVVADSLWQSHKRKEMEENVDNAVKTAITTETEKNQNKVDSLTTKIEDLKKQIEAMQNAGVTGGSNNQDDVVTTNTIAPEERTTEVKKDKGITESIFRKLGLGDVKLDKETKIELGKLYEKQNARAQFYTGGSDMFGDPHENFVVQPGQQIVFDQDIWQEIVELLNKEEKEAA